MCIVYQVSSKLVKFFQRYLHLTEKLLFFAKGYISRTVSTQMYSNGKVFKMRLRFFNCLSKKKKKHGHLHHHFVKIIFTSQVVLEICTTVRTYQTDATNRNARHFHSARYVEFFFTKAIIIPTSPLKSWRKENFATDSQVRRK